MSASGWRDVAIDIPGRRLAALAREPRGATRVLALHGWLDNAASFSALAPLIDDVELIAVDLTGHGQSDHMPAGCWYHHVDVVDEVIAILDALGWERATLLGHSMGAAAAALVAAARPDRVDALWLIEALGPISTEASQSLALLRRSQAQRRERGSRGLRTFAGLADAVAARQQVSTLSTASAMALVERGTRPVEGGWQWSSDSRLTLASAQRATQAQVVAWLGGIECATLLVLAEPAATFLLPDAIAERVAVVRDLQRVRIPGGHHLHMDDPGPVAAAIAAFRKRTRKP